MQPSVSGYLAYVKKPQRFSTLAGYLPSEQKFSNGNASIDYFYRRKNIPCGFIFRL
jgi:hypothetical protein